MNSLCKVHGFKRAEQFCDLSNPKGIQNLPVSASKIAYLENAAQFNQLGKYKQFSEHCVRRWLLPGNSA